MDDGAIDGELLGHRLMAEYRRDEHEGEGDSDSVVQMLRFGAEGVDDETLWVAAMTAVHLAVDDGERWLLGDGIIDESVGTRPNLATRWKAAYRTDEAVRAVHEAMWADLDSMGVDRGWWDMDAS